MKAKVILVEPHYGGNIGFIARAMKNFGIKELALVQPIADHLDSEAKSRAMHAREILEEAKIFDSLQEALKEADIGIATTAISSSNKIFRSTLPVKEFAEKYACFEGRIGLVFGRETNGLRNEEIEQCDLCVKIPSNKAYPTLNLSHSAAILFHELFQAKKEKNKKKEGKEKYAGRDLRNKLNSIYSELINNSGKLRNKKSCKTSFSSLISRTPLTDKEAKNLIAVLKEIRRE